jgi:prephenate dehydratase
MYVRRVWPDAEMEEYLDTATAAKDLAEGKLGNDVAVIASRSAAQISGLEILEESIQDLKFNYTTFIVAEPFLK